MSAGIYQAEGRDAFGRVVGCTGTDPDSLLRECIADASAIHQQLDPMS